MGMFEAFGTFLIYFVIMDNFGYPFSSLWGMGIASGWEKGPGDVYDATDPYFGNSNLVGACDGENYLNPKASNNYT